MNLGDSAPLLPLLLNSVTTFLFITGSSGIDVFSSHQQSSIEIAKRY